MKQCGTKKDTKNGKKVKIVMLHVMIDLLMRNDTKRPFCEYKKV